MLWTTSVPLLSERDKVVDQGGPPLRPLAEGDLDKDNGQFLEDVVLLQARNLCSASRPRLPRRR